MKYLKNLALFVALCMALSTVPIMADAAVSNDRGILVPAADNSDNEATAAPTETPDVEATSEPEGTTVPEATEDPEASSEPDATLAPEGSAEPTESAAPATSTPTPTATAGGRHSITIESNSLSKIKTYVNSTVATSAVSGATIRIKARAARGYNYQRLYYKYNTDLVYEIISGPASSVNDTVTMPDSDIVICADVIKMSDNQLYNDAQDQYNEVTANLNTYTARYVNNASAYDASDIREMRSLISEAKEVLPDLREEYTYFGGLVRNESVTDAARSDIISVQEQLDDITDQIDDLIDKMGGNTDGDSYRINVSVSGGGRVVFQGAAEGTIDGNISGASDYFLNVPYGIGLSLRFTSTTGYTVGNVRINNQNVALSGTTFTINASNIQNYVVNGIMSITVNFVYGQNGYTGPTYGGSSSGSTNYNNPYYNGTVYGGSTATAAPTEAPINGTGTPTSAFTDLADVEWAIPSINALSSLGIINGMGDGRFEPRSQVTREQFAKMIVGVMGYTIDQSATTDFSDDMGDWYTPYIAAAVQNGIITGRPDGTFGVGDDITRQDIAVIIYRAQGSPATEAHQFPDSGAISDYAVDAVSYLFNSGIASGDDQGNFNPVNPATRAEAAKMLYGLYISLGK